MKKWTNNTIYPCRELGIYPQVYLERIFIGRNRGLKLSVFNAEGAMGFSFQMSTRMARILGKRIKLALEDK